MSTKVVLLNVNSVVSRQKRHDLTNFLSVHKPNLLLLTESKLHPRHKLHIPNYTTFRSNRVDRPGGGTAILVANPLDAQRVYIPNTIAPSMELTVVSIATPSSITFLGSLYCPDQTLNPADISNLAQHLKALPVSQHKCFSLVLGGRPKRQT